MTKPKQEVIFAVLARVSTRSQEDGQSLPIQIEACRAYALRAGATKVLVYEGVESGTGADRDILDRLLGDVEPLNIRAVVMQDLSRLARHPGVMFATTERFRRAGVVLHDLSGPIPFETPEGEFRVMIESVVGRFTARQSVQKSISARARVLASGKPAAGRPPWGRCWSDDANCYEAIPDKRARLQRAHDLIVRQRFSLNKTASKLNIQSSSLRKAISQSSLTEVTQCLAGKEYKFKCERVLTEEQHLEVDLAIAANVITRPRTKGLYLLQGLVRCAACGATMTGQTSTKDGKRYAFYRHPVDTYDRSRGCVWHVPVDELDPDVLTACANVVGDGKLLQHAIEAALAEQYSAAGDIGNRLKQVEVDIQRASIRLQRTVDGYVAFADKPESLKRLIARADEEEKRLQELRAEGDELSRQAALLSVSTETAEGIAAKVRSLYWGSGVGPERMLKFEQRREFVRTIVGRTTRDSAMGVYVRMYRPSGGSKKNVRWRYRLDGRLALAENSIGRHIDFAPEVVELRPHSPQHARALAGLARATAGVPRRLYPVQLRTICSSGA